MHDKLIKTVFISIHLILFRFSSSLSHPLSFFLSRFLISINDKITARRKEKKTRAWMLRVDATTQPLIKCLNNSSIIHLGGGGWSCARDEQVNTFGPFATFFPPFKFGNQSAKWMQTNYQNESQNSKQLSWMPRVKLNKFHIWFRCCCCWNFDLLLLLPLCCALFTKHPNS